MEATLAFAVWFLCVCSLGNVKRVHSSHFLGGLIQWRPVNPAAFDGRVQITHRIAWRRNTYEGGSCTQATVDAQTLLPSGGHQLTCQSGCSGNIGDFSYYCTDFSVTDNWSAGERTYTYNFTEPSFEAEFASGDWISLVISGGSSRWELRVRGNLTYREDTGLINSSPVVSILPLIRIQRGCSHTIKIPVVDADGDHVRCRWAESYLNECGDICRSFPVNIYGRHCEIQYTGSYYLTTGDYAVALQVEDFMSPTDTTPLSSVPVQFVVRVGAFYYSSCYDKPELLIESDASLLNGSYFEVPFNTSWRAIITNSTAQNIREFVTASPLGMEKSIDPGEWEMNVTWTPFEYQLGPNIFCYAAIDNIGLQSAQRCVVLLACFEPPAVVPDSVSPRGKLLSNQSLWSMSIQFDKQFARPDRDTYIRIFGEEGDEVVTINARTSAAVTYPNDTFSRTLIFDINFCQLPVNHSFYILLDGGVAVGTEFCHVESPPLMDQTVWTFMTAEHTDTYYTTDFTTVDYTISSTPATTPEQTTTRKFVTSEHTEALATSEQTETPDTSEKTEVLELVTSGHTDTAPSFNTQAEIESRETTSESVCLANSVVITVCTLLSLTFLFGVICGLIADRCVCALLKRKEKQQSKVSLRTERSVKMDHYVMGETAEEITADIYDEITPDCKPA